MENPYKTLEIPEDADLEEIRSAFRKMTRKYHPDVSKEPDREERIRDINIAWAILGDVDKRKVYDETGTLDDSESIQGEAAGVIINFFRAAIDQNSNEPLVFVRNLISTNLRNIENMIIQCRIKIPQLTRYRKNLKSKTTGDQSLVHQMIDQMLNTVETNLKKFGKDKLILGKAQEMVNDYEFIMDQPVQQTSSSPMMIHFVSTSSTGV
jgi:curved DNA-binding protein CbpA